MDDDAELEAEIQRELENEEARNNEQLLANMREREKAEEAAIAKLQVYKIWMAVTNAWKCCRCMYWSIACVFITCILSVICKLASLDCIHLSHWIKTC